MSMEVRRGEEEEERPLTPSRRRTNMPLLRLQSVQEEIKLACVKGNMASLEQLIKGNPSSINQLFEDDGWSALMVAANGAHPTLVKFLLSQGADPNFCRADGFSPLMAALTSSRGRVLVQQVVQLLIDAGANVNSRSDDGLSPLLLAVKDNRVSAVDLLVFKGADVHVKDANGRMLSELAKERKFDKILQTLEKQSSTSSEKPLFGNATISLQEKKPSVLPTKDIECPISLESQSHAKEDSVSSENMQQQVTNVVKKSLDSSITPIIVSTEKVLVNNEAPFVDISTSEESKTIPPKKPIRTHLKQNKENQQENEEKEVAQLSEKPQEENGTKVIPKKQDELPQRCVDEKPQEAKVIKETLSSLANEEASKPTNNAPRPTPGSSIKIGIALGLIAIAAVGALYVKFVQSKR